MKKRALLLCMAGVFLVGCGEPLIEMSESQEEVLVTYASGMLLKHSPAGKHGLMFLYTSQYEEEEEEDIEEEETPEEDMKEEASADASSTSYLSDGAEEKEAEVTTSIWDVYDFGGATLDYDGYAVADSYVQGDYFSITPSKGKTFLELKFTLVNDTGDTLPLDIAGDDVSFSVSLNGKTYQAEKTEILDEDLTSLETSLSNGSSLDTILFFEVPQDQTETIESLQLRATKNGNTGAIVLE